ncbi:MAG: 2'-5' RNA ligase family protein [Candidatus Woesearchaeota archaeon]
MFVGLLIKDTPELLALRFLHTSAPLHLTLKHLGDVDVAWCVSQLQKVHSRRFTLTTQGVQLLGRDVICLGVVHNKLLFTLQQKIDKVLSERYEPQQSFVPHITLGRGVCIPFDFTYSVRVDAFYVCDSTYKVVKKFALQ